jgi:hypothetical protein
MSYHDPDFDAAPRWLVWLIRVVIISCFFFLAAAFFYALLQLP